MSEVSFRHEIVGLDDALDVGTVDANRNTHDHVLRPFGDVLIDSEEVGTLQRLEAKAEWN